MLYCTTTGVPRGFLYYRVKKNLYLIPNIQTIFGSSIPFTLTASC